MNCFNSLPPGYRERAIQRATEQGFNFPDLTLPTALMLIDGNETKEGEEFWDMMYTWSLNKKNLPDLPC